MELGLECIQKGPEGTNIGSICFTARHGTEKSDTEDIRSGPARNITACYMNICLNQTSLKHYDVQLPS